MSNKQKIIERLGRVSRETEFAGKPACLDSTKSLCSKVSKQVTRPTFYFNGDNEKQIRAGGGIFYKTDIDGNINLLLINTRNKFEDFGGKTDGQDTTINDTIAREIEEESNGIFKKKNILKRIKNTIPLYTKTSKYLLYFIKLTDEELAIDPEIFGTKELYDDIDRTVEFVPLHNFKTKNFIKDKIASRLKFKAFFNYAYDLEKMEQDIASLFIGKLL